MISESKGVFILLEALELRLSFPSAPAVAREEAPRATQELQCFVPRLAAQSIRVFMHFALAACKALALTKKPANNKSAV